MLQIQLFGTLSIQYARADGSHQALLLTSKLANMFAFLSLYRGRYFSRDELVAELWDDLCGNTVSQGAFNTILWRLRKNIEKQHFRNGELFERDGRGFICFRKEANVYLDIEEFKQKAKAASGRPVNQLTEQDIASLNRAITLYQADILGNFTAEWAIREREKLRRIYFSVLARLIEYSRLCGDFDLSISYAQMVLDSEPLREDVHRELMELYELSGQRALALKQFETCRNLLRKELAIPPMQQTMKLYQSITNTALHPEVNANSSHTSKLLNSFSTCLEREDSALEKFDVLSVNTAEQSEGYSQFNSQFNSQTKSQSRKLMQSAREHLAIADEQLKSGLELLDVDFN
ncbi:BTAD domain-containing putative transcriptional regulator [Aliikangiella sp. G2MR2-5]|uniref:AfsR/SARP family transcriptional regulator n=1 Tax=Aliikangiella sp. G2MR2-5 TaxID=2788943 RepID=UPI0018ABD45E|nr:BTAD domain-containing putative transcriptional regulator [Aliikangiella sp. G2MR2-5]